VAKTIQVFLSPEIIADFESCFETPKLQRTYLYEKVTQGINSGTGDVFQTKTCNLSLIENGKRISKSTSLDDIGFYSTEIPTNPEWRTKNIAGDLVPFEFIVGASLWDKINNFCKLNYILNIKFNDSVVSDAKSAFDELKSKGKATPQELKQKEESIKDMKKALKDTQDELYLESSIYAMFAKPILDKNKEAENTLLVKEEAELVKSLFEPEKKKKTKR